MQNAEILCKLRYPSTGKKHLLSQVLFSTKFVPAERVKYADACEIACGSEIRLRRVKERILFHIEQSRRRREIFHNFRRKLFHILPHGEIFHQKLQGLKSLTQKRENSFFISLHQAKLGPQRYCVAVMCPYRQGFVSLHRKRSPSL